MLWGGDGAAGSALPGPIASALLKLTHPHIPMCTKRTSFLLDQYCSPDCREESNRSLEKFALAAQKQTNKQASKQIKPNICLKIAYAAYILWKS